MEQSVNHTVNSALDMLFEYLAESNPHNVAEFSRASRRFSATPEETSRSTWNERRHRVSVTR